MLCMVWRIRLLYVYAICIVDAHSDAFRKLLSFMTRFDFPLSHHSENDKDTHISTTPTPTHALIHEHT